MFLLRISKIWLIIRSRICRWWLIQELITRELHSYNLVKDTVMRSSLLNYFAFILIYVPTHDSHNGNRSQTWNKLLCVLVCANGRAVSLKQVIKLGEHRIVIWPDSRIPDIRLFKKFNIQLSGRISGRCYSVVLSGRILRYLSDIKFLCTRRTFCGNQIP